MNRIPKILLLLAGLTTMAGLVSNSYAFVTLDSSGKAPPECGQDTFFNFRLDGHDSSDAKKQRYTFTGTGVTGTDRCGGESVPRFTVQVEAEWDESTKQASELVMHGFPAFATTRIVARCLSNPWTTKRRCDLVSYRYSPTKGGREEGAERAGRMAIPVSGEIPQDVKESLRRAIQNPQDFALEPQMPPRIFAPLQDEIVRRNAPLRLQIERPEDGNTRWYAENPPVFDVEFQTKKAPVAGEVLSIGGAWIGQPVLSSAKQGMTTLPYSALAKFSWQPDMDVWRVRARLQSTRAKPWSEWRVFFVEPPLKVAPNGAFSGTKPESFKIPAKMKMNPVPPGTPDVAPSNRLPSPQLTPQMQPQRVPEPASVAPSTVAPSTIEAAPADPAKISPSLRPLPAPATKPISPMRTPN